MLAVFPGCTSNFFSLSSVFLHDISGPNFMFSAIVCEKKNIYFQSNMICIRAYIVSVGGKLGLNCDVTGGGVSPFLGAGWRLDRAQF